MCGIFGVVGKNIDRKKFSISLDLLNHRGPDNKGETHLDNLSLGHTRLSIQDLTISGNQPFEIDGNLIIYNGEIYNFKEIKKELISKNIKFKSNSDTEVLLRSYLQNGLNKTLKRLKGMYSFAIYDNKKKLIFLVRDKYGMKPLYYSYTNNNNFIFSSEIKAIRKFNGKSEIDRVQLLKTSFFGLNSESKTNFTNIQEVKPGYNLIVNLNTQEIKSELHSSLDEFIDEDFYDELSKLNLNQTLDLYKKTLNKSVNRHLVSDAETSILYSGGLDSSIVSAISSDIKDSIKCFYFNSYQKNDLQFAQLINEDVKKNLVRVDEKKNESIYNLPKTIYFAENIINPSTSSIQILTNHAKNLGIKSMLTGDSADELFGGYSIHEKYFNEVSLSNSRIFQYLIKIINYIFPGIKNYSNAGNLSFQPDFFNNYSSNVLFNDFSLNDSAKYKEWFADKNKYRFLQSIEEQKIQSFILNYFKNNLKRYMYRADIAGMMNSVELRIPFLDDEIVKLALNTQLKYKIKRKFLNFNSSFTKYSLIENKVILRSLSKKFNLVNNKIITRQKKGIFLDANSIDKILKSFELINLQNFLKLTKSELNGLIDTYFDKELSYVKWSLLQSEIFLRLFDNSETHEKISEKIRKILN